MNIASIATSIPSIAPVPADPIQGGTPGASAFGDMFKSAIDQVESSRNKADQTVDQFLTGEGEDLHSTIMSVQRADLEFQLAMQVRNKVVSAYQEVMRMQL